MSDMLNDNKYLHKEVQQEQKEKIPKSVMPVVTASRKKLGEILVEKGLVTWPTVERLLPLCKKSGIRFGNLLEELGLVTSQELAQALAVQYNCKTVVDIAKYHFSSDVLKLVPIETAVEHTLFPLKVQNNVLALAVFDPTNEKVIENIKKNTNLQICQFIATKKHINEAIAKYYLRKEVREDDGNTVLIVENEKVLLTMLMNILVREGYRVVTASDGMEAYRAVITNRPNLILTDAEMPKFDGYALLASLKSIPETNKIPVILLSGSNNREEEAEAYEKGFFDYVPKPVNELTLKAKVKRAIKSHRYLISLRGNAGAALLGF